MNKNPNLTPTIVTDKNGRLTTVYKRQSATPATTGTVPAPVASPATHRPMNKAELVDSVAKVVEYYSLNMDLVRAGIRKFLNNSTPEQIEVIEQAVGWNFNGYSENEQIVINAILTPLTVSNGETRAIHELLALREAFCSKWAEGADLDIDNELIMELAFGLRGKSNYSTPLDTSDEDTNKQNIALLRFAYETAIRSSAFDELPTAPYELDEITGDVSRVYKSDDLVSLIRQYSDRVDELIDLSLEHKTVEAHQLRALMEHEGHSSLVYGML